MATRADPRNPTRAATLRVPSAWLPRLRLRSTGAHVSVWLCATASSALCSTVCISIRPARLRLPAAATHAATAAVSTASTASTSGSAASAARRATSQCARFGRSERTARDGARKGIGERARGSERVDYSLRLVRSCDGVLACVQRQLLPAATAAGYAAARGSTAAAVNDARQQHGRRSTTCACRHDQPSRHPQRRSQAPCVDFSLESSSPSCTARVPASTSSFSAYERRRSSISALTLARPVTPSAPLVAVAHRSTSSRLLALCLPSFEHRSLAGQLACHVSLG